jgi:hypothetical protein
MKKLSFTSFILAFATLALVVCGFTVEAHQLTVVTPEYFVTAAAPVTLFRDEEVYGKIKNLLRGKLGLNPDSVVMAPSFLKSIVQISNSASVYKFNLKTNESVVSSLVEQRLDRNDIFITSQIGYGILAVVSGNFGKAKLATYPNQTVFPAVTTSGSEFTPDDLQVFWNSTLSLKVGNTVFIPNYDTSKFYYAPETQKSGATNYDMADGSNDGFVDLVPQAILSGESNIDLQVQVPVFSGIKVANTNSNTVNYLALIQRGFLIKEANSAVRNAFREYLK